MNYVVVVVWFVAAVSVWLTWIHRNQVAQVGTQRQYLIASALLALIILMASFGLIIVYSYIP